MNNSITLDPSAINFLNQDKLLMNLFESTSSCIVLTDPRQDDNPAVYCNQAFYRLSGYLPSDVIGKNFRFLQKHDTDQDGVGLLREAVQKGEHCKTVIRNFRKDGSLFWNEVILDPVYSDGELIYFIGVQNDVTHRVMTELALKDSSNLFSQLSNNIEEVIWIKEHPSGAVAFVSPSYEKLWGQSTNQLYQDPNTWMNAIHEQDVARIRNIFGGVSSSNVFETRFRIRQPGEAVKWIQHRSYPVFNESGKVCRVVGISSDVTQHEEDAELIHQQNENHSLKEKLITVSHRERMKLGQDLHDGLGQSLTGIIYLNQALREQLAKKGLDEAKDVEVIIQKLRESLNECREIARGLYPVNMDQKGLPNALWELAENVSNAKGVQCTVKVSGEVQDLDIDAAVNIYRIVQEASANAVRHGDASHIAIYLTFGNQELSLLIEDNGRGFGSYQEFEEGMGLKIMKYRAESYGARLNVQKGSKEGVVVSCDFDINKVKQVDREDGA